eukprot:CAMPEP_0117423298 /NCGR_PEP_ID=MMETSP0758-20121206/3956_1 /TAXON_ID=63605 /ORGANISM="Percolomonas cosmopolitus, Strain AE-1 (ATCC 50343)" /LENGTH=866 /DNA_ID=CAMNT_0005206415 /DNA_START=410 /DNA_END=3007 /DNA_ORIENTATION=+
MLQLSRNIIDDHLENLIELSRKQNDTTFEGLVFAQRGTGGTLTSLITNIGHATSKESIENSISLILRFKDQTKTAYEHLQQELSTANDREKTNIEQALYLFVQSLLEEMEENVIKNNSSIIQEFEKRKIIFDWGFHKPYVILLVNLSKRNRQHEKTLFKHIQKYHEHLNLLETLEVCGHLPEICSFVYYCLKNWHLMLKSIINAVKKHIGFVIEEVTQARVLIQTKKEWLKRLKSDPNDTDLLLYRLVNYRRNHRDYDEMQDDDVQSILSNATNTTINTTRQHVHQFKKKKEMIDYDIDKMITFLDDKLSSEDQEFLHQKLLQLPEIMSIEDFDMNVLLDLPDFKPYWFDQHDYRSKTKFSLPNFPISPQNHIKIDQLPSFKELMVILHRIKTLFMDKIGRARVLSEQKLESMWFRILRPFIVLIRKLRYGFLGRRPPSLNVPLEDSMEDLGVQTIDDLQEEINECFDDIDEFDDDLEDKMKQYESQPKESIKNAIHRIQLQIARKKEHIQSLQQSLKILNDASIQQIRHVYEDIHNPNSPQHMNIFSNVWCHSLMMDAFQLLLNDMTSHLQEPRIVRNLLRYFSNESYGWIKQVCLPMLYTYEFHQFLYQHAHQLEHIDQTKENSTFYSKLGRGSQPSLTMIDGLPCCVCKLCNKVLHPSDANIILFHCRGHHVFHQSCYLESKKGIDDDHKLEGNYSCPICIPHAEKLQALEKEAKPPVNLSEDEKALEALRIEEIEEEEERKRKKKADELEEAILSANMTSYHHLQHAQQKKHDALSHELLRQQHVHHLKFALEVAESNHKVENTSSTYDTLKTAQEAFEKANTFDQLPCHSNHSIMNALARNHQPLSFNLPPVHLKPNHFNK